MKKWKDVPRFGITEMFTRLSSFDQGKKNLKVWLLEDETKERKNCLQVYRKHFIEKQGS